MDSAFQSLVKSSIATAEDFNHPWGYLLPVLLIYVIYSVWQRFSSYNGFPTVNLDKNAWTYASAKAKFISSSRQLLNEGAQKVDVSSNPMSFPN
jgi:hypothetical protein